MRRCSARPYEGDRDYIFVSYCHADKKYVYPVIERLAKEGYRIWYDEGIDPGTEWPEIIAQHLNGCTACIAFISGNSLNSHNCRREVNFALLKKKPFISIILEQVSMSLGMEMQLSSTQAIFKFQLPGENEFFQTLLSVQLLSPCQGQPDLYIRVSSPRDYEEEGTGSCLLSERGHERDSFSDQWFISEGTGTQYSASSNPPIETAVAGEAPAREPETPIRGPEVPVRDPKSSARWPEESKSAQPPGEEKPVAEHPLRSWLVRTQTNEQLTLPEGEFLLGRGSSCHYIIEGNVGISRSHASIVVKDGRCFLVDHHAKNKTYLNQRAVVPELAAPLKNSDVIRLADEEFVFYQE